MKFQTEKTIGWRVHAALRSVQIPVESNDSYRWKPGLTQQDMRNEQQGPKISALYSSSRLAQQYLGLLPNSKDSSGIVQTGESLGAED